MDTSSTEDAIRVFETRVRQMVLQFRQLQKENKELRARLEESEEQIQALHGQLEEKEKEFETYKMAKVVEISDGDLDSAKRRLSKLIRDVNKCITMLAEQD